MQYPFHTIPSYSAENHQLHDVCLLKQTASTCPQAQPGSRQLLSAHIAVSMCLLLLKVPAG